MGTAALPQKQVVCGNCGTITICKLFTYIWTTTLGLETHVETHFSEKFLSNPIADLI